MKTTIIVPVYNESNNIVCCVESLIHSRERLFADLILVDNSSTDDSMQIMIELQNKYAFTILSEKTIHNAYGARNSGILATDSDIVLFTDADCTVNENWIEQMVLPFADLTVGCVAGVIEPLTPRNTIEKYWSADFLSNKNTDTKVKPKVLGGNCAYRRNALEEIGLFRADLPSGGDAELADRMIRGTNYRLIVNPDSVVYHRNISSMEDFIKQSMRYGTHQKYENSDQYPTAFKALTQSLRYIIGFIKNLLYLIFKSVPIGIPKSDYDIFLFRPLFRAIFIWAEWVGFKFARKNHDLVR